MKVAAVTQAKRPLGELGRLAVQYAAKMGVRRRFRVVLKMP